MFSWLQMATPVLANKTVTSMFVEAFESKTGRKLVPWQKKQHVLLTWAPVTFGILAEAPGVANTWHTSHLQHAPISTAATIIS